MEPLPPPSHDSRYFLFYKPYGVLSQFTSLDGKPCLKEFGQFPRNVYAAGRLDFDSEGALLLSNDNRLNHVLTDPRYGHPRTYLIQVEGIPSIESLAKLESGVFVQRQQTRPAHVRFLPSDPPLPPRSVPIRTRKNLPTSWLEMTIREGRNRQVRRMTAAVGHPTLRLIRIAIGPLTLDGLQPGEARELSIQEIEPLKLPASLL